MAHVPYFFSSYLLTVFQESGLQGWVHTKDATVGGSVGERFQPPYIALHNVYVKDDTMFFQVLRKPVPDAKKDDQAAKEAALKQLEMPYKRLHARIRALGKRRDAANPLESGYELPEDVPLLSHRMIYGEILANALDGKETTPQDQLGLFWRTVDEKTQEILRNPGPGRTILSLEEQLDLETYLMERWSLDEIVEHLLENMHIVKKETGYAPALTLEQLEKLKGEKDFMKYAPQYDEDRPTQETPQSLAET